jgi:N-dimethylarginine dimethylaminohydrolase
MCAPTYFEVKDVKNAFMEGNLGKVNFQLAQQQWQELKVAFEKLGKMVCIIEPVVGLEDMVFTANQVLPGLDNESKPYVLLSHMRHESRKKEVPFFRHWFESKGYKILELESKNLLFEGQGDGIWHPGKKMLWGGYGHRTSLDAYYEIAKILDIQIIALELPTNNFYHLDTCFCPLDSQTVLIYSEAFTSEGLNLIRHFFPRVIEVTNEDACKSFACNAHVIDYKYVVIQKGATQTIKQLQSLGFEIIECETSEFIKSGGSIFCMKMMIY